jgi:hypothetical protein
MNILKRINFTFAMVTLFCITCIGPLLSASNNLKCWVVLSIVWALNTALTEWMLIKTKKELKDWEDSGFYFTAQDMSDARKQGALEHKLKNTN